MAQLDKGQRIVQLPIPTSQGVQERWIDAGYAFEYITAFGLSEQFPQRREFATESPNISQGNSAFLSQDEARQRILTRYLTQIGPVTMTTILARYAFPTDWLQRELECLVENRDLVHGHFTPAAMDTATDSSPVAGRPQNGSVQSDDQRSDQNRAEAEFVDRRTLEQIHRRTLNILRQEVRPVPLTVYADFLTRWQHLHPDERLDGAGALRQVLQQLRVSPVVGTVWERDVLRLRLADGNTSELETLCHSGEVVWVGTGGVNPRRGRIRFLFRGEGNTYLEQAPTDIATRTDTDSYTEDEPSEVNAQEPETLSSDATAVYEFLKSEGAVFQADIRDGLDLTNQAAQNALTELAMAGLVTNDSLAALRRILGQKVQHANANRPRSGRSSSSLEAQLAERLGSRSRRSSQPGGLRRPSRSEFRAAKKRVRERLAEDLDITPAVSQSEGRWTLVHRFGVMGKKLSLAEQIARQTHQLLARYGVVTRESLAHEAGAWEWNMIYQELQRLEIRGEVRRGIFVHGLTGVQFALPEVVERLRELSSEFKSEIRRENDASEAEALVLMNACDPANLYGPANEMAPLTQTGKPLAFSRLPSTWLVLSWGLPILLVEQTGASLTTVKGTGDGMMRHAIRVWLQHASSFMQRVTVKEWNGQPVLEGDGASMLESIGFYRDYPAMTWER
ncbi:hypothetical protein KFU94_32785 [Chloroflexi bacterium TSY]|nr:hypothetical protein [Chloroflexi bacterium TSY]